MTLLAFIFLMLAMMVNGDNQILTVLFLIGIGLSLFGGKLWTTLTDWKGDTMSNLEIVKTELLKQFSVREVEDFIAFIKQDKDLLKLADKNPHSPRFAEILKLALDK